MQLIAKLMNKSKLIFINVMELIILKALIDKLKM